eukprot:TRINITY_DN802_c0_g1_i2.p1 TRINITY_DN802_c0_g1~~TRINITY_DN802_c0_g1_i2.p1  ORF type:complete len:637 (+),score=124.47 TRINITY_DN802_c0_g1_i2:215-1912(+)
MEQRGAEEKAVTSKWTKTWPSLLNSSDHKIRVGAFKPMSALAKHLGKRLGPHLREIVPAWVCSMFDTHQEVQLAAKNCFNDIFPLAKHPEVIAFCSESIISFLNRNMKKDVAAYQSPNTTPEEAEEKYIRLTAASIYAIQWTINLLGENNELYPSIFSESLWKHFNSNHAMIRKSIYSCVAHISRSSNKGLIKSRLPKIAPPVLAVLSENDKNNFSEMWSLLLTFMKEFPEAWNELKDPNKEVFTKLFEFLRNGAGGSVECYPCLLPFLSLLPVQYKEKKFYDTFFNSLWKGFQSDKISKATEGELINSYMECLLFTLTKLCSFADTAETGSGSDSHSSDPSLANTLFDSHFIALFKAYLFVPKISPLLASALSSFVSKLSKKPQCEELTNIFFQGVSTTTSSVTMDSSALEKESKEEDLDKKNKAKLHRERLANFLSLLLVDKDKDLISKALPMAINIFASFKTALRLSINSQIQFISDLVDIFGSDSLIEPSHCTDLLESVLVPFFQDKASTTSDSCISNIVTILAEIISLRYNNENVEDWSILTYFEQDYSSLLLIFSKVTN